MLKPYSELRKVDISRYCMEREGIKSLNWATCLAILREYGAEEVYFEPIPNPKTGGSLYYTDLEFEDKSGIRNRCYETRIRVVIDGKEYIMQSPVMNGSNPVNDNSMNQQRVWNSLTRSFVKCVAIHTGLGFDLWLKEEQKPFDNVIPGGEPLASKAQIQTLKNLGKKHKVDMEYWLASNNRAWDSLTGNEAGTMLNALKAKYGDD